MTHRAIDLRGGVDTKAPVGGPSSVLAGSVPPWVCAWPCDPPRSGQHRLGVLLRTDQRLVRHLRRRVTGLVGYRRAGVRMTRRIWGVGHVALVMPTVRWLRRFPGGIDVRHWGDDFVLGVRVSA